MLLTPNLRSLVAMTPGRDEHNLANTSLVVWCRANPEAISWRWSWLVNVGVAYYNKSKSAHIQPFALPVHFPLQRIPWLRHWPVSSLLPRARHPLGTTSVGSAVRGIRVTRGVWPPFITVCSCSYHYNCHFCVLGLFIHVRGWLTEWQFPDYTAGNNGSSVTLISPSDEYICLTRVA